MSNLKLVGVVAGCIMIIGLLMALNYAGQVGTVVSNEIAPSIIQEKYVWFQGQKASIDKADADIKIQIASAGALKMDGNRSGWDRTDKEQFARSLQDIAGVIAMRNGLVRDYNGAMSQWNMRIANLGSWPQGAQYSQNDFNEFPNSFPEYNYGEELGNLR